MITAAGFFCLMAAVYFEARDQDVRGQYAVAEVIMNRVESPSYPDDICSVVYEDRGPHSWDCQFSFACDGEPETMTNRKAEIQSAVVAYNVLLEPTFFARGATHYHADFVSPAWSDALSEVAMIDNHIFYVEE